MLPYPLWLDARLLFGIWAVLLTHLFFSVWDLYDLIMFSTCDSDCHTPWDIILFVDSGFQDKSDGQIVNKWYYGRIILHVHTTYSFIQSKVSLSSTWKRSNILFWGGGLEYTNWGQGYPHVRVYTNKCLVTYTSIYK
jgi:hypothetical protein